MKRRWNANTWVLVIFGTVILLVGIDIGRRAVQGRPVETPEDKRASAAPPFKVGDVSPDFTLPDNKGVNRSLAELVKGDTVLTFSCGCNSCREMQTYMGKLQRALGPKAPAFMSVTSSLPETEESWVRDTRLKQTILYQPKGGTTIDEWKGHPCPRNFRLDASRKVTYIGPSPSEGKTVDTQAYDIAENLGFATKGTAQAGQKQAPRLQLPAPSFPMPTPVSAFPPPSGHAPGAPTAPGAPGADPHAGHNHAPGEGH
jgi:hypothetical protein